MSRAKKSDKYSLEFELDGLPPMNSADGMHWRVRRKLRIDWELRVELACRGRKPTEPLPRAQVEISRFSSREPDFENMAQGGKFLLDGLVKCGVLLDDRPSVIGQPVYRCSKIAPKQGKVRISVFESPPEVEIGPRVIQGRKRHE